MNSFRPVIAALLAALIIVTSQGMAFARGQTMVAGQIVLCTGHGPQVINIGIDGDKVETPHLCPDCALAVLADVPPADVTVRPLDVGGTLLAVVGQSPTLQAQVLFPTARGPPASL